MRGTSALIVGLGIFCTLVALTVVAGVFHADEDRAFKAKAAKFDDYCLFVRVQLDGTRDNLREHRDTKFVQVLARKFYESLPQLDKEAVSRCSAPPVDSKTVNAIYARCRPPGSCILDDADPRCRPDPACVVGVIDDLLELLPRESAR